MSLIKELGKLLITLENASTTVFGDDACITHLVPSAEYEDNGTILDITVAIIRSKYNEEEYKTKMDIFNNIIYNPIWNSDRVLSKVNIIIDDRW